jgi:hypothetical protein
MFGLAHEVLSIAVLVAASFVAFRYTGVLAPHIAAKVPGPAFVDTGVSFLVLFGLTLFTGRYVNTMIRRVWLKARKSPGNRLAGLTFGIFKGAVVVGGAILMLRSFTPEAHASQDMPTGLRGRVHQLNEQVGRSYLAPRLAEMTTGLFTTLIDTAERQVENMQSDTAGE